MKIRKYNVSSLSEAKSMILRDLGKDAIIVQTNKVKAPGLKGFFGKKNFEVLAALDGKTKYQPKQPQQPQLKVQHKNSKSVDYEEIKRELQENNELIAKLISENKNTSNDQFFGEYNQLFNFLVGNGVQKQIAYDLIVELTEINKSSSCNLKDELKILMENKIKATQNKVSSVFDKSTIALVGPTGVGKTTSIAKLAANAVVAEGNEIGLITLDTYRIAATEQLKTYGDIIDVPVTVAYNHSQFKEKMRELANKDNVFIDTAGRSHKNQEQLEEQKSYFDYHNVDLTLLVVSLNVSFEQQKKIFEAYSFFKPQGFIVTKTDEADFYGNLYNLICEFKLPIYYLTTGQSVPDDITKCCCEHVVEQVLEGDK
ncbi:flagellar biosynthesis protein FlhF [Proteinivorax tanatarense]|uniref:Flagellar biosynthesis protein FlhF n=1 Tax=Proteinivorax tanatarense TaxID=1260629 RepID=A0AAU7VQ08_9FIRM